jgi:hypothetical protein
MDNDNNKIKIKKEIKIKEKIKKWNKMDKKVYSNKMIVK